MFSSKLLPIRRKKRKALSEVKRRDYPNGCQRCSWRQDRALERKRTLFPDLAGVIRFRVFGAFPELRTAVVARTIWR